MAKKNENSHCWWNKCSRKRTCKTITRQWKIYRSYSFCKKKIREQNPKLKVNINIDIIDFHDYKSWKDLIKGDVLFSCLRTPIKAVGSKEVQWKVSYEYQYKFVEAGSINHIKSYF